MAGVFQERKTSCAYQTSEINNSTLKAAKLGENKYFTIRMVLVQHSKIISLESQFSETIFSKYKSTIVMTIYSGKCHISG